MTQGNDGDTNDEDYRGVSTNSAADIDEPERPESSPLVLEELEKETTTKHDSDTLSLSEHIATVSIDDKSVEEEVAEARSRIFFMAFVKDLNEIF